MINQIQKMLNINIENMCVKIDCHVHIAKIKRQRLEKEVTYKKMLKRRKRHLQLQHVLRQ